MYNGDDYTAWNSNVAIKAVRAHLGISAHAPTGPQIFANLPRPAIVPRVVKFDCDPVETHTLECRIRMRREIPSNLPNPTPTIPVNNLSTARRFDAWALRARAMQLRHERRRRLFSDDVANVSSGKKIPLSGNATGQTGRPANSYTEAAQMTRDRAVCTLLPARLHTIGLAVGGCLMLVAACLSLHVGFPAMASLLPADDVAFLRLDAPGSVGHWLASALLAVAGVLAAFIYSLRRHRIDDYHGRYRVWIWILTACLAASLAETTGLGRLARAVCRLAAEWSSVRSEALWSATFGLVVAAIGLRLFFEIRRSHWAVAALAASAIGFLVAAAANAEWPARWTGAGKPLLVRGSWLVGYVFVLATFLLYSRYVQLDVVGAIAMSVKRKRSNSRTPRNDDVKSEPSEPSMKPALRFRTDLDPVDVSTVDSNPGSQQVAGAAETDSTTSAPQKSKKHLSKAERRQMRRQARATRMAS